MTVVDWLMEGDPAIRWQVMRDLLDEPSEVVAAERARVAREGWGARLLALQGDDGQWDGGTYFPAWAETTEFTGQPWTATTYTLLLLRDLGADPGDERVRAAIGRVRESSRWEEGGQPFFEGEVEPCINGMAVAIGAYFGEEVSGIVEKLLGEQLADGGWNCQAAEGSVRSSFHTTINVVEGLLEYEAATGGSDAVRTARARGEEYLLERRLLRRRSTGDVIEPDWLHPVYPPRWHYDILRGLDHLRRSGADPDPRAAEAVELLEAAGDDGTWRLERVHSGAVHFDLEEVGGPSRWNTLRARRVLDWYEAPLRTSRSR
jgi:hypothetical protein